MENTIKEAISIMQKAYDEYRKNAQKNLGKDNSTYWHWQGIAEGTRRSWELLEELFGLADNECNGMCGECEDPCDLPFR